MNRQMRVTARLEKGAGVAIVGHDQRSGGYEGMKRAALAGALAALLVVQAGAVLAQAGCPTAADLARGIRIDFADGSFETFRDPGTGLVTVEGQDIEGYGYTMELGQGLHLVSYANMVDGVVDQGSRIDYDYGVALPDLPVPVAGGRWASPVVVRDMTGTRSEPQNHVWSEVTVIDIGGCSYDMIEALIAYKTDDGYRENVHYLPELGIGYLLWSESDTAAAFPIEAVRISVVSKK